MTSSMLIMASSSEASVASVFGMGSAMAYFNLGAAFFILISMAMMLGRLIGGPTLYDRLLAVNSFGTKTVLFLCVFCFVIGRPDGVDIAILYALMNFIATIAVLKYFSYQTLGVSLNASGNKPDEDGEAS